MRILIADDSLLSRRLLERTLEKWGYQVTCARDGSEARAILVSDDCPPIAILDWMMPGSTGPELCDLVRRAGREPYTYILLLTSRNEKGDLVTGMESGADDYITKPFDRHELQVRLRAGTRIVELQQQLLRTREALREQATRDYLTKLWNRSAILDRLRGEISRSERDGTPFGLILADIDRFKSINDSLGHPAGDVALQEVSSRITQTLRPYDSVGRYGGEEFLIVLPGADLDETARLAERVRQEIRSKPMVWDGTPVPLSCSFGCTSSFGCESGAADLIRIADESLYAAKRGGRDRVVSVPSGVTVAA